MKMSKNGIAELVKWEGIEQHVYADVAGYATVGIGHLLTRSERSSGKIHLESGTVIDIRDKAITEAEAYALLKDDLPTYEKCVDNNTTASLTQNQFDALTMFTFNVGVGAFKSSTLRKKLNAGLYKEVPTQLRRWNRSGGRVIQGLINRREAEIELWNSGHIPGKLLIEPKQKQYDCEALHKIAVDLGLMEA